jgi:phospholipase C
VVAEAGAAPTISRRSFLAGGLGLAGAGLIEAVRPGAAAAAVRRRAGSDLGAVEHVVFLMQENRSFDHYFGTYPGVNGFDTHSAAFTQAWPVGRSGATTLLPFNLGSATAQLCSGSSAIPTHDWAPQHESWGAGTNADFVSVHSEPSYDGVVNAPIVMGYFTRKQLAFCYGLADAYTICDNYFCSVFGPTHPNRLYFMSGMLDPTGTHGGPIVETAGLSDAQALVGTLDWDTMPEVLEDKGVSWKMYQPAGSAVGPGAGLALAISFNVMLYFKQYVSSPSSALYQKAFLPTWPHEFAADVKNDTLPAVSWIMPPIAYSEHPNSSPASGEWVSHQVLKTLQSNPKVWAKTVLFINYDENGGFFDHVVPPTPPPGTPGEYLTVPTLPTGTGGVGGPIGLGFRVPMLVASPFSAGGWVDSTPLDHTSALRFLEERFDVTAPNLTAWRRRTVGDLTTTLGFGSPNDARVPLPATPLDLPAACPTPTNLVAFLTTPEPMVIPTHQTMARQEPGTAKRRHR